ncbi:PREDICTED: T-cell leukemia/lymphoma protein 1A-like [Myotis davidii]|uniref:T-cell leukemia/lymphoma protein 1A-like n=1 Tax=Myotis davidii TaxID=225400 RepID=UPI00076782F3|nr:PREDICTED: T-cell leukemia/lymphoma protein 1A-like [Myotis davidii]
MAELPLIFHLSSHPNCLSIRGPSVYEDENHRTWLHHVMDTEGHLLVQLSQVDYPSEHNGLPSSPLTSNTMPSYWTIHLHSMYLDSMDRFWRIVHHVLKDDMEEMILELMDDS